MKVALILSATVMVLLILAFLPTILTRVLDPRNMKVIRAHCEAAGLTDVEIKPLPNHYGVSFRKNGKRHYAKCRVTGGVVKWKGKAPEQI